MSTRELSSLLWQERRLLERLLYRLKVEQLLLTAGESRWLPWATAEVEAVLGKVREANLSRDVASHTVAESLGLPSDAGLREIVAAVPDDGPWAGILGEHLAALTGLVAEIRAVRDHNARLVAHGVRSTQETIASLAATEPGTYDATGSTSPEPDRSRLFDTVL